MTSAGCVSEISKRLQEGWTLLNQHCPMPSCDTPLLKDHKKQVYCAKCQMYCISADKAKSLGAPNGEAGAPAAVGEELVSASISRSSNRSADSTPANTGRALRTVPEQQPPTAAPVAAPAVKKKSRAAAEAVMGERLLQGWAMLAEECPNAGCCFPLMRDRSRKTTCVACGSNGVAAAAVTPPPAAAAAAPAAPAGVATGTNDLGANSQFADAPAPVAPSSTVSDRSPVAPTVPSNSNNSSSSVAGGEPELMIPEEDFAAVRKKRDALSASLGRYMLQGWSLLDKMCPREGCEPGTPLLKNRSTAVFYCAGCDTRMREGEGGSLVEEPAEASGSTVGLSLKRNSSGERSQNVPLATAEGAELPAPAKAEPLQVASEYELVERARLRKQAAREQSTGGTASATLAERLLQGWAMLSVTCPTTGCHSPLMRDKSGKEQCISCSSSSGDTTAIGTPRQVDEAAADAVPVQAAGDFAAEMETEDEQDQALLDDDDDDAAGRMYSERRMAELLSVSTAATEEAARAVNSEETEGAPVERLRVKNQAVDALFRALDQSQQRLRACSSSDVDESMRQADLIAKLAVATRAVLSLPSNA